MAHVAMVRSSSRTASQRTGESQQEEVDPRQSTNSSSNVDQINDELSQMSVISISSSEAADVAQEIRMRNHRVRKASETTGSLKSTSSKVALRHKPMTAPLDRLATFSDIEACLDSDQSQFEVLNRLEEQWHSITSNMDTILNHLKECSGEVSAASNNCLESLENTIETTCDSVDGQVKALYHLMTKCDELTTKLSAAGSFRDEVKTLRKSVETLESLYKTRPQSNQRRHPASQSTTLE